MHPRIPKRFFADGIVNTCIYFVAYQEYNRYKLNPDHEGNQYADGPIYFVIGSEICYIIRKPIGYERGIGRSQATSQRKKISNYNVSRARSNR